MSESRRFTDDIKSGLKFCNHGIMLNKECFRCEEISEYVTRYEAELQQLRDSKVVPVVDLDNDALHRECQAALDCGASNLEMCRLQPENTCAACYGIKQNRDLAEKTAECARLALRLSDKLISEGTSAEGTVGGNALVVHELKYALAAAEVREAKLREALEWYSTYSGCLDGHEAHVAITALALTERAEVSALSAALATEWERAYRAGRTEGFGLGYDYAVGNVDVSDSDGWVAVKPFADFCAARRGLADATEQARALPVPPRPENKP